MSRIEYAIVIRSKTRLELLIERFNTAAQARFYIERSGGDFAEYEQEHEQFEAALSLVQRQLAGIIKNKVVDRSFLPSFIFADNQVVVVVGQDGLVANTAKYVGNRPIVAVNPDPARYDGQLLPFRPDTCQRAVQQVIVGKHRTRTVGLAQASLNDGQRLLAFNDLFVGAASHVSARYKVSFGGQAEEHSSSGIIVSTPAGSTGWLSSVFNMTAGVEDFAGGLGRLDTYPRPQEGELLFVVREPFRSRRTQCDLVAGRVQANTPLLIESRMPAGGVIFSDGIETDFLKFNAGAIATIGPAPEQAWLVQPS